MKMPRHILDHLPSKEEREVFQGQYANAKSLRAIMIQGLTTRLETVTIESEDKGLATSSPDYAVTQAFYNGQKASIREMIQLLSLDQD